MTAAMLCPDASVSLFPGATMMNMANKTEAVHTHQCKHAEGEPAQLGHHCKQHIVGEAAVYAWLVLDKRYDPRCIVTDAPSKAI